MYLGGALSSITIIMITSLGWRLAYDVIGIGGIAVGVLTLLFVIEPKRGKFEAPKAKTEEELPLAQRWLSSAKEIF